MRIGLWILMAGMWAGLAGGALAQKVGEGGEVDLGTVQVASGRPVYAIGVPEFQPANGSQALKPGALSAVILNDLALSGFFKPAKNQTFVEEIAGRDRTNNRADSLRLTPESVADWGTLEVDFVTAGTYNLAPDGSLSAACILYDASKGGRVLGRQYNPVSGQDNARRLGHAIANDIIFSVTGTKGIANTKIIYISKAGGHKEVFVMDADGANRRQLTHDGSTNISPAWGANATEFYYTSFKDNVPDLCGMYLSGAQSWFLSRRPGFSMSADYCQASRRVAVALSKDGNSEIYTMDREGKNLERLTKNKAIDTSPSWSPDGSQIVFVSDRDGVNHPQIYMMDPHGQGQRRITMKGSYNTSPAWSPRGDRIVFSSRDSGGDNQIVTMNPDGTNWRYLTSGSNNEDPTWAPDGAHIAFASERSGEFQIYTMNDDGANVRRLTDGAESTSPAWSPFPGE